jgi:hypothetical protein
MQEMRSMGRSRWILLLLVCLASRATCEGQEPEKPPLLASGKSFWNALAESLSSGWADQSLRQVVQGVERHRHVAVWIDRRVDSEQPISLSPPRDSLYQTIQRIAHAASADVVVVEPVVAIVPSGKGPAIARQLFQTRLATIAAKTGSENKTKIPASLTKAKKESTWIPMLTTPGELIAQITKRSNVRLDGSALPHDLMPRLARPPMSDAMLIELVAAGFEMRVDWMAKPLAIKPAEQYADVASSPTPVDAASIPTQFAVAYEASSDPERWASVALSVDPDATTERGDQGDVVVLATPEAHAAIELSAASDRVGSKQEDFSTVRLTLTQEDIQAQPLLQYIAMQLGLTLDIQPGCEQALRAMVAIKVENATIAELLSTIGKQVGLRITLAGQKIQVAGN